MPRFGGNRRVKVDELVGNPDDASSMYLVPLPATIPQMQSRKSRQLVYQSRRMLTVETSVRLLER